MARRRRRKTIRYRRIIFQQQHLIILLHKIKQTLAISSLNVYHPVMISKTGITILLLTIVSCGFFTSAAESDGDCKSVFSRQNISNEGIIYPDQNIKIAINNLKSYCCEHYSEDLGIEKCTDTVINNKNYANSNRIYDHLIDIGFRSLDGNPNLEYPLQKEDENWKARYTRLNTKATDPKGVIPFVLRDRYGRYRGFQQNGRTDYNLHEFSSCENNAKQYTRYKEIRNQEPNLSETENKTQWIWLASKYMITCHIARCIIKGGQYNSNFSSCKQLALQRIQSETNYIQILMIQQGLLWLTTNFNAYTQWYMIQWQFGPLLEQIQSMNQWLETINNKVGDFTRTCSS